MENVFIYLIKASGLIGLFYFAYMLLLRKETFFSGNRWYLLLGLMTSAVLPLFYITKIIWIEPTPTNIDWTKIPITTSVSNPEPEINWYSIAGYVYFTGIAISFLKLVFDFNSLISLLKGKTITREANFKFIDITGNITPFSYFNYIVYNSTLYTATELDAILEHEKVHSEQKHSIDVLISRLFCIVFWFNPILWFYKKAILQNLEFIADYKASKRISDKKAYQMTLLKITTQENCVALTNHFYQSLIKKRIIMLNKNQSEKWNSLKYVLVIPALVAFVFLFQTEIIAKEKHQTLKTVQSVPNQVEVYKIDKNSTEAELKEKAQAINKNYGVTIHFSKIKRNTNNELTAIEVAIKGKEIAENRTIKSTDPIKAFAIVISKETNGKLSVDFVQDNKSGDRLNIAKSAVFTNPSIPADAEIIINGEKANKAEMQKLAPDEIESVNVIKNSDKKEVRIITKNNSGMGYEEGYFINGEKVDEDTFKQTDPNTINRIDVNHVNGKKTIRLVRGYAINQGGQNTSATATTILGEVNNSVKANDNKTIRLVRGYAINQGGQNTSATAITILGEVNNSAKANDNKTVLHVKGYGVNTHGNKSFSATPILGEVNNSVNANDKKTIRIVKGYRINPQDNGNFSATPTSQPIPEEDLINDN